MTEEEIEQEQQTHIQDSFRYLICHTGICVAAKSPLNDLWTVHINGRLFVQIVDNTQPELFVFKCHTPDHGLVRVSFLRENRFFSK